MRQKQWMDLLKKFDCKICYQAENVIADALSRKNTRMLAHVMVSEWEVREPMQRLEIKEQNSREYISIINIQLDLIQRIKE